LKDHARQRRRVFESKWFLAVGVIFVSCGRAHLAGIKTTGDPVDNRLAKPDCSQHI
jgi:hypothetical protein